MNELVKVFYIGLKPERIDTVNRSNGARGRIWRGFGTSLPVPADEAAVLCNYRDVWCTEADFEAAQERKEAFDAAVLDRQLREQERAAAIAIEQAKAAEDARKAQESGKTDAQDDGSSDVDRDTLLRSAILSLDPASEKDYTKTKPRKPRADRITEIASTSFSADEIGIAFQELVASGLIKVPA